MSLTNSPDPAVRKAAVRQDLDKRPAPDRPAQGAGIDARWLLRAAKNSTIFDADGTGYLDAMAGLWCVNIGYGRVELADDRGRSDARNCLIIRIPQ